MTLTYSVSQLCCWSMAFSFWVACVGMPPQKCRSLNWVKIFQDLLERQDYILGRVITGDETWVYQYDPETKLQTAQRKTANSPQPKTFRRSQSWVKTMLLTFFYMLERLLIMNLYQLDKQSTKFTIWKYWKGCVKKLDENDPKFLPTTHGSCITTLHVLTRHCLWGSFLATKHITVLEHPAYSPDLAPSDFFSVREDKGNIEKKAFWWQWWHQG